jgi:hypothetical protein
MYVCMYIHFFCCDNLLVEAEYIRALIKVGTACAIKAIKEPLAYQLAVSYYSAGTWGWRCLTAKAPRVSISSQ